MRCIYFNTKNCLALPPAMSLNFEPSEEDKKGYCESGNFYTCPRLRTFHEYANAINGGRQHK